MRILLLLLFVFGIQPDPAAGQDKTTTVRIEGGAVYVDGRRLAVDEYPSTLRVLGQNQQYTFSGDAHFLVNGRMFGVQDGRIVEVPNTIDEDALVVYFREQALAPESDLAKVYVEASPVRMIRSFAQVLDNRADRIETLSREASGRRNVNLIQVAEDLQREAAESAVVMRAFPRIEMQTYLEGLQGRNSLLYDRLMDELHMESESARLATEILAADQARRAGLELALRQQLNRIFELKQQNRRDEIGQLEQQLSELRTQLAEREANRRAIIDRRVEALIGPVRR